MPPAARASLRVIALLGCALLAILTIPDHSPTLLWKWPRPVLVQLMLALPAVWLLVSAIAAPDGRSGFDVPVLAAVALLLGASVVSALAGPYSGFSSEFLTLGVGPLLLFLTVGRATAEGDANTDLTIARAIAGGLAALCALSFLWWLSFDVIGRWLNSEGHALTYFLAVRNESPLGHANYTAGIAVLALGWSGGLACLAAGRARKVWIAATAVSLATLFSSGSRGGWIGLAVLAATAAWFWMVRRGANRRRIFAGVSLVALATIALAIAHPRTRVVIELFQETGALNTGDVQRLSMAQAAVHMAGERPLLGFGPGATPLAYPAFRAQLTGGVETALQLHNTPLQILADTGFTGLAGALLLAALVALRLRAESREPRLTVAGCAAIAFIGYAAFSMTDFQLDVPVIAAALAATAALALRAREGSASCGSGFRVLHSSKSDGGTPDISASANTPDIDASEVGVKPRPTFESIRIPPVATMIAVVVWLFLVVWTQRGPMVERARYSASIDALERSDFAKFRSLAIAGEGSSPPSDAILNSTALILADPPAYGIQAPPESATAIDLLRTSLAGNRDQEIARFNLGWLLLKSDPAEAAQHFREAARLVPDKGGVYLGLSSALLAQGEVEQARIALAAEMVSDPAFCASPLWSTPTFTLARAGTLFIAADQLDSIAPDDARARRVAALFRWLAGDDSQPAPAADLTRDAFNPPIESASGVRRQRTGYPLLMRNADMPAPVDVLMVIDDPTTRRRLAPLFPAKGWLTGPQMRKLVGED
ncbi:MAG TPA: O-antigen ligase family protein [Opitutaceae bacterium]|nr:O-antigen ligase family protein [Opitutaceae bacterium]